MALWWQLKETGALESSLVRPPGLSLPGHSLHATSVTCRSSALQMLCPNGLGHSRYRCHQEGTCPSSTQQADSSRQGTCVPNLPQQDRTLVKFPLREGRPLQNQNKAGSTRHGMTSLPWLYEASMLAMISLQKFYEKQFLKV